MENQNKEIMEGINTFIAQNSYELPPVDYSTIGIECIDDRSDVKKGDPVIRIPGARLGVLMDAFGVLTLLKDKGINLPLSADDLIDCTKSVIGGFDYHTDENHQGDSLMCAGCGHCAGAFANPGVYLMDETMLEVLRDAVSNAKSIAKNTYNGSHAADGVVIIDEEHVAMPSKGENGGQYYVYNQSHHNLILGMIAEKVFEKVKDNPEINLLQFTDLFKESAEVRLKPTVHHLAEFLPKYVIGEVEGVPQVMDTLVQAE